MEKVKRFFRKLNEKRAYQVVFFVVSMCVILVLYGGVSYKISYQKMITVTEDKNLVKYIEDVKFENEELSISGWCFYRNVDSNKSKIRVFLRNLADENDIIWLDTQRVARDDVDAYYGGTVDYSQTGFVASKNLKKRNVEMNSYEIMITFAYDEELTGKNSKEVMKTVATNRYIHNGFLSALRLEEDVEPVRGIADEFNEILENGQLLVHRDDYGMYIYQYKGKIYWIAENKFYFEEDGTTTIQYQLDTTRFDKLPIYRTENNWFYDNLGFAFEHKEIIVSGIPYRVAVSDIPTSYPVTGIETGYYTNSQWIWREYLNLDIRNIID